MLLARIYQPIGDGPFPVLLDLHGGARTFKDRMANAAMAGGIVILDAPHNKAAR